MTTEHGGVLDLSDREPITEKCFGNKDGIQSFSKEMFIGNGQIDLSEHGIVGTYSGDIGTFQLSLKLPDRLPANGVGARIRLRGWESINYIAIGYTGENGFEHVKAANPALDQWFDFTVSHNDLAWLWQNKWTHRELFQISDIRLYIKGVPGQSAHLDVSEMAAWNETPIASKILETSETPVPSQLIRSIRAYEKKCFGQYTEQAQSFMTEGKCPLYGNVSLDWPVGEAMPPELGETGTYQFSWHALHPAIMLLLYADDIEQSAPVFAARDFVMTWLTQSYDTPDENVKYAWYDHGTAERCLAFLMLYAQGETLDFDRRCMDRLRIAIFRHAQLLASEVFYASHQPTRYHNHAWFQDIALLATGLAFPEWPCAASWSARAIDRLEDQFDKLIIRDEGFSVFIENSIGYHLGVQRLVEFAGELAAQVDHMSEISDVSVELQRFSEFFRYPDSRRSVSQGDTFRLPNSDGVNMRGQVPYLNPSYTNLSKAGYAIWKGNHENRPFMLTMLATSLSKTHKHEDNLALSLYFDGLEWLIDTSFHSHEYTADIPAYLRSSAAHNCVTLPGKHYSIEPGHSQLWNESTDAAGHVAMGQHTAYEGVTVTRRLGCELSRLKITGQDRISIPQNTAQLRFHCGEHVSTRQEDGKVILTHPGSRFALEIEFGDLPAQIARGRLDTQPMAGIVGHTFLKHDEINTLIIDLSDQTSVDWTVQAVMAAEHQR